MDSLQDLVIRVIPSFGMPACVGVLTVSMWWLFPPAGLVLAVGLVCAATLVPWLTAALAARARRAARAPAGELAAAVWTSIEGAAELIAFGAAEAQVGHPSPRRGAAAHRGGVRQDGGRRFGLTTLLTGLACSGCLMVAIPAVGRGRIGATHLAVIMLVPLAAFELVAGLPVATQVLTRCGARRGRVFEVVDAPSPVDEPHAGGTVARRPYDLACAGGGADTRRTGYGACVQSTWTCARKSGRGRRTERRGQVDTGRGAREVPAVHLRDGRSRREAELDRARRRRVRTAVGLVGQDAFLFDTTIAENLRVGDGGGHRRRAARGPRPMSAWPSWLDGLPSGLATEVGRNGARVSGGQRQRLASHGRCWRTSAVLVLDEPAEHLDAQAADELTSDLSR